MPKTMVHAPHITIWYQLNEAFQDVGFLDPSFEIFKGLDIMWRQIFTSVNYAADKQGFVI